VLVRNARPEDSDAVWGLLQQLNPSVDRGTFDATWSGYFSGRSPEVELLVAEDDARTVRGYALVTLTPLLYSNGLAAQLHEIVADDAARGEGIGSTLVHAVEDACRSRGAVQLTVAARRSAGFYDRLGYAGTAEFLRKTF
jgi:ribosomal protein S18 acetylase RimI-like enzyme